MICGLPGRPRKCVLKLTPRSSARLTRKVIELKPKAKVVTKRRTEVSKHQYNIRQLMMYSNATPIRCRGGIGYMCCFCADQFPDPADLKRHTIDTHDDETKNKFMDGRSIQTYVVKLDITDLCCKICGVNNESIEEIMQHLTAKHGKTFHLDIKSHIIPFRFNIENFSCVFCPTELNNFKVLLEHMNMHFRNHVCEICGCGFVNLSKLQTHGYRHKTGVFNCSFCAKVFDNRVKQKDHERAVHVYMNKRSKCGYCDERFRDYTQKNDHEVKVHGAKPIVVTCNACDKNFDNQRALNLHKKTYHMLQKRTLK